LNIKKNNLKGQPRNKKLRKKPLLPKNQLLDLYPLSAQPNLLDQFNNTEKKGIS